MLGLYAFEPALDTLVSH